MDKFDMLLAMQVETVIRKFGYRGLELEERTGLEIKHLDSQNSLYLQS